MRYLFHQWTASYAGLSRDIWLLALVNLINRFGGMVIAFITLYLTQELGFSIPDMGILMGVCFGGGALAGAWVGGRLVDKYGYYHIQVGSLLVNGLILISLLWIRSYMAMGMAIFALSFVAEAFRPANQVAMATYSTPENRTRSISLMRMAFNLGWTFAPAMGGLLKEAFGWEILFWVDGLTCIAAAIMLAKWLGPVARSEKEAKASQPQTVSIAAANHSPWTDPHYLLFIGLTFLAGLIFMQILWNIPVFMKEVYHWSEGTIGLMAALNGAIVFMVEMPLIYRIEHRKSKLWFVRLGILLYAVSYLSLNVSWLAGFGAALIYMTMISIGEIFVMPFSSNFVIGRSEGSPNRGEYMALYTMSYSIANIASPLFGTQVIDKLGYNALWWIIVGLSILAWIGFWQLEKTINRSNPLEVSPQAS